MRRTGHICYAPLKANSMMNTKSSVSSLTIVPIHHTYRKEKEQIVRMEQIPKMNSRATYYLPAVSKTPSYKQR